MDERALQFRVGAMVVGSIFIAMLLLIIFHFSPSLLRGRDTIYIKFDQAPGITQDTPVRKSGVLIGRVSDVTLRERDVLVTAKIDRQYTVYENEICRVATETLLGDSMIEFVPPPRDAMGQPLEDGALIEGRVKSDAFQAMEKATRALEMVTQMEDDVEASLAQFRSTSEEFGQLAAHLDQIATNNEDQFARAIQKSETAMDTFQTTMANINDLVGDEQMRRDLQASLSGVPQLIEDTRVAVNKYAAVADRADRSLEEAEKFTQTLGELGESSQQMSQNVDAITEKLDRLILDLLTVSEAINKQEGTLGQLVYNPELYQRLNRAAGNIEQVSGRLRPVVEDVRVFSDKIARDPSQLGLKGALENNQTGSKFLPFNFFYRQNAPPMEEFHWTPTPPPHNAFPPTQPHVTPALPNPQMYPVQPSAYAAPLEARAPDWQPTRPPPTTPQQFWQSR